MSKRKSDGLALLTAYFDNGSDSDLEEEADDKVEKQSVGQKTNDEKITKRTRKDSVESNNSENQTLPLPKGILNMFTDEEKDESSLPGNSDGRIRSFAHFPGNWALHVYTIFPGSSSLEALISSVINSLPSEVASSMHLFPMNDLHISLSRTVPVRHYWIEPITAQLKEEFTVKQSFQCTIDEPQLYVNDEKTRSFLGLKILTGHKKLEGLTSVVNKVFEGFSLPKYYENPSFHVSVAWCLGDIYKQINEKDVQKLKAAFDSTITNRPSMMLSLHVKEVKCKIGNKLFSFLLLEQ